MVSALCCFCISATLYFFFGRADIQLDDHINQIEENLESEVLDLQREVVPILATLEQEDELLFTEMPVGKHAFYVFNAGRLVYWSDYRYVPEYRQLRGDYTYKLISTLRKKYLSRKWQIQNSDYEIYGIIMLHSSYKIDNNYVHSGFNTDIFSSEQLDILDRVDQRGTGVYLNDKECLFRVILDDDYSAPQTSLNYIITILFVFGCVFLVFFALSLSWYIKAKGYPYKALLILATLLVLLRGFMLFMNFPQRMVDLELFDSRNFASSSINASFGDLLLNLLFLFIISLYCYFSYYELDIITRIKSLSNGVRLTAMVLFASFVLLVFHFQYLVFQTIYHNSQVSFDINQGVNFDIQRTTVFLIFVIGASITFLLYHVAYKYILSLCKGKKELFVCFSVGVFLFAVVNILLGQLFIYSLSIGVVLFLVLVFTGLPSYAVKLSYNTFLYFFTFLIASAIIGALAIYNFENEQETERKLKFANQFLIENDNLAEYLLSEVNFSVREDLFIQGRLSSPFLSKEVVKSKIRQVYLGSYFDKYDVQIYLYNANGNPFEPYETPLSPEEVDRLNVEEYKTGYEGIYFINRLGLNASKRYVDFIEVKKRGVVVGYIVINLNLKRIIPDNVYPELLVDNRFLSPYQNSNYSYAVFSQDEITYHSGDFNYITDFETEFLKDKDLFEGGFSYAGFRHLAIRDNQGRIIVISSNNHPSSDIFSNFSFLFLLQVFTLILIMVCFAIYFSFQRITLNYSARIQLYLNAAFFLPLIAVSITTLSVINSSFKKEVNEEYYRKAESISNNLSDELNNYIASLGSDKDDLRGKLSEVSKYAGVDVNLFSTWGKLLGSSQPLIYENDLLSQYINPRAIAKIKEQGENAYVTRESVGKLNFNSTFYAIKSFESGKLIGILSIPFFQSEYTIQQNQVEVLTNIMNIFSVIFIIFLLVSYLAAKWLTFPLVLITQKLKKTTLTGFNEPLTWKSDDEIGLMVSEYNRMLVNLEESKKALARTEKESAWREIAQQVAHEIKNPLTPMKLTLQHLSRRLEGTLQQDAFEKPLKSLLVQVDTLNDIASSFSSFAKMPIPENEIYELAKVVKQTVDLLGNTENTTISLEMPSQEVYTRGDEQLMGRIISNIIINAIQACEEHDITILIQLTILSKQKALLEIKDNGPGIDEDIHNKIFIPNFSTKETGSGIGLAIAKHGVEHAGGKIWFETEQNSGTSFFIELPIVNDSI
ncbi:sensor histidine kinase [Fulvivirga sediminis]|uniref:histidine kinase n=1 Tax=Fulvivirga sediminis TaxID=2803949 RepID=A0A937F5K4_9BACT|nr:HAMP domain-containing sensor histidine kinase [Fulvivirga sediminis]MBL3655426.1 HAMP domain-containing histidine kinase [Fulvivirga sediminis]